ncbi:MAG: Pr6Pr family membrane protein [Devosia sp.]
MSLSKLAAIAGVIIGAVGLSLDFIVIAGTMVAGPVNPVARSLPDMLVYFWTFFTHLSNLALVLVYLSALTQWRWLGWFRSATTRAAFGGHTILVMAFFHFVLAPNYQFTGMLLIANYLLHYVAPIFYLLWWALLTPHGALRWKDLPLMLVPGIGYVAWVLLRGALVAEYPYEILNPAHGLGPLALGIGGLLLAVALFCALLILLDKPLARWRAA